MQETSLFQRAIDLSGGLLSVASQYEAAREQKKSNEFGRHVQEEQLAIMRLRTQAEADAQSRALFDQINMTDTMKRVAAWALVILGVVLIMPLAFKWWRGRK